MQAKSHAATALASFSLAAVVLVQLPASAQADPCFDDPASPACDVFFDDLSRDDPFVDDPNFFDDPSFDDAFLDDPDFDDPFLDDPDFDDPFLDDPNFFEPSIDDPSFDDPFFDDPSLFDPAFADDPCDHDPTLVGCADGPSFDFDFADSEAPATTVSGTGGTPIRAGANAPNPPAKDEGTNQEQPARSDDDTDDGSDPGLTRWANAADAELVTAMQAQLLTEIDILTQLQAIAPRLEQFDIIAARYGDPDRARFALLPELKQVDTDGTYLLEELKARDVELSPAVVTALRELPETDIRWIEDGKPGIVDAPGYLIALSDALYRGGRGTSGDTRATLPVDEIVALLDSLGLSPELVEDAQAGDTVVAAAPEDLGFAETPEEPTAETGNSSMPVLAATGAGALLVLVGGATALARRGKQSRSADTAGPQPDATAVASVPDNGPGMAKLLDASRRMSGTLEREAIASIAVQEAAALTDAEGGAFLLYDGSLQLVTESPLGLVVAEGLDGGALARVAETGQHTYAVTNSDPGLTTLPVALAAVPVIANAGVAGVLLVVRSATRPFEATSVERMGMLAPMIGSALTAASAHESVAELAHIDGLTQLHNRRRLDEDLPEALAQCRADNTPMCFAMVDVDHFKTYNDTHGHGAGDVALQLVAETIRTHVREQDVVYRYGGEEFSILLPGADLSEAGEVAERVRHAIEDAGFAGEDLQPGGKVTVSVGMALAGSEDPETLRHRADEALYEAKETGRNKVTVAG